MMQLAHYVDVASSMTIRDSKPYTVTLRDATWQDGHALTADDVVYILLGLLKIRKRARYARVNWTDAVVKKSISIPLNLPLPDRLCAVSRMRLHSRLCRSIFCKMSNRRCSVSRRLAKNPIGSWPVCFAACRQQWLSNAQRCCSLCRIQNITTLRLVFRVLNYAPTPMTLRLRKLSRTVK